MRLAAKVKSAGDVHSKGARNGLEQGGRDVKRPQKKHEKRCLELERMVVVIKRDRPVRGERQKTIYTENEGQANDWALQKVDIQKKHRKKKKKSYMTMKEGAAFLRQGSAHRMCVEFPCSEDKKNMHMPSGRSTPRAKA